MRRPAWWATALALLAAAGYALATVELRRMPRRDPAPELLVSVPALAQIFLALGDRYLAANLNGFRVLVASTERMSADDYVVQARLQEDLAWLNPAHEDNYYIAEALLPWNGQVDAAERIMARAVVARPFDASPFFYRGFHAYQFYHKPAEGAQWLLLAAEREPVEQNQWAMQNIAAKWIERGYELRSAAEMVDKIAVSSKSDGFRKYLQVRSERLRDLARLREAATVFREQRGVAIAVLEDLVKAGLIDHVPVDPLKIGYAVSPAGEPVFASDIKQASR